MKLKFAAAIASVFLACPAYGQVVLFNSFGFEPGAGYVLGNLDSQQGWGVDTPPGSFTVQNALVANGAQAAGSGAGATNWIFPAINYAPAPTEQIRVECDIARTNTGSFGYGIDIYNSAVARTFRFGLANAGGGTIAPFVTSRFAAGVFSPANPIANVLVGGAVPASTFVHFEARLDYVNKNVLFIINGNVFPQLMPFADLTAIDMADADWHVSSTAGNTDMGFLDNYQVTTVAEPTSMALMGLGALAFGLRRKLRRTPA